MSIPTFIDVEVTDQTSELRSYLKELGAQVEEEGSEDNVKELLTCIEASDVCWKEVSADADLEMVFNGIISMLLLIPLEMKDEPVHLFCKKLADCPKGDKKGSVRLRILSNLFHGLEDKSPLKADVYLSLLRLSRDADLAHMVITDLDQVKKWISEWDIGTQKIQNIYRALHETLISARMSEQATKVMIELLGTYTEDNASQARDDAQRCIATCLEDPNTFLLDHLLSLKPVKFLEGAPIHDLLTIFVSGKLADYLQFYKNNQTLINSLGLSHEENQRKMRLLTFMQMAETRKDIDYESIMKELDISEDEVENFIIDVVKTRSVQVKIDQLQKKVIITSTTHRTFGRQHWQMLHQKLVKWQQNLANVQTSLRALEIMQQTQNQQTSQQFEKQPKGDNENQSSTREHWSTAGVVKPTSDKQIVDQSSGHKDHLTASNDEPYRIRLLSWNIDGLDPEDVGPRITAICDIIQRESPDIVFIQEAINLLEAIIRKACPNYHIFPGRADSYYALMMLKKDTVQVEEEIIVSYPRTSQGRNLVVVKCTAIGEKLLLLTSHLESMKDMSEIRIQQLKACFNHVMEVEPERTVLFGGDLNLRDWELEKIGGVPLGIYDVWELMGRNSDVEYTWDMGLNDNKEIPFPAKLRFDRIYIRHAAPKVMKPVYFGFVGTERLEPCGRFCSDHWGLLTYFDILAKMPN